MTTKALFFMAVTAVSALVLIACRTEEVIAPFPISEADVAALYERLDAYDRQFVVNHDERTQFVADVEQRLAAMDGQFAYLNTELNLTKGQVEGQATVRPQVDWSRIDDHISRMSDVIVHSKAEALQAQWEIMRGEWETFRFEAEQEIAESIARQEQLYIDAIGEVRDETSAMRQAYEAALQTVPPVPPNILHQQAAMPRPKSGWSVVVEPRLSQSRQHFGRISMTGIADEDVDKIVSFTRLPIQRRGVIFGYVQTPFPSERYWSSSAIEVQVVRGSESLSLSDGVYFTPELPLSALYPCQDVVIFASMDGGEWAEAASGCNPQIAITQDVLLAVAVDVQRSN